MINSISNKNVILYLLVLAILFPSSLKSQEFKYNDPWGPAGYKVIKQNADIVEVNYSIHEFTLNKVLINEKEYKSLTLPGVFLPNDAGKPDLAGVGRLIAIPQNSKAEFRIISYRKEVLTNVDIAPAPVLPLDNDPSPLNYTRDERVYSRNEFYPENPVSIGDVSKIRGVDCIMLGVTPFQYNPVSKELVIFRDLKIEVKFTGGNGQFGDNDYRSRWWEPILSDIFLNYNSLPVIDFNTKMENLNTLTGYEYVIITPNGQEFIQWADTLKKFRTEQGIKTGVVTLEEIGNSTVDGIKNWVINAYNTWQIKPVAICLLADYGSNTNSTITSKIQTHPAGYPAFASDNYFSDINNDEMPDIVFSRIIANNATELQTLITKNINYERNPPVNPNFYLKPITALGWQTERWFQVCSEVLGGFFRKSLNKQPVRINKIYSGTPGTVWSTATNTSAVTSYFGPTGRGYLPASPDSLGNWNTGTATMVVNAINSGSFLLQHRDHGMYTGWGEPAFTTTNIPSLTNTDLTFIYSINCETGAYHNPSGCPANGSFVETFYRHKYNGVNAGALGLVCPSEVSYSFVNDAYCWGMYDNMWPNFLPDYGTTPSSRDLKPAFGMAAGKYFLKQSSWPYNTSDKLVTYRLFHMHGDAFLNLFSEVPQNLMVIHPPTINQSATQVIVTTNDGAFIALTSNGKILGTALSQDGQTTINLNEALTTGQVIKIVVTKQNYFRFENNINVVGASGQVCKDVNIKSGWNILSVPVISSNMAKTSLFPSSTSNSYCYSNGYMIADTLKSSCGYWLKFNNDEIIQICGSAVQNGTIPVQTGWNLIGIYESNIPIAGVSSTPSGIISSQFYGYSSGYTTPEILEVGKGYWVKANANGNINLMANLAKTGDSFGTQLNKLKSQVKITIKDNINSKSELYIVQDNENTSFFELPPPPPSGIFDCRFENNKNVINETENSEINVSSAVYPLSISADGVDIIVRYIVNGERISRIIRKGDILKIDNPSVNKFQIETMTIPVEYTLSQNFPNPFNPVTTINYSVPENSKVTISIYDMLGRNIETLVDKVHSAGKYSLQWPTGSSEKLASGTYYYELKSGEIKIIRKMLLMK